MKIQSSFLIKLPHSSKWACKIYQTYRNCRQRFWFGTLKQKNWSYLIERLLEVCTNLESENIVGTGNLEEVKIINDSVQNLTICEEPYKNLHNSVPDNLREYFNHVLEKKLNKIDKDLRLNYFLLTLITNVIDAK